MLSHVCVGITDFERAFRFYSEVGEELGWRLKFAETERNLAGWMGRKGDRPLFFIGRPFDGAAASVGNGQMLALEAGSREAVRMAHAVAMAAGGSCEGEPGLRPQYHPHCYAAYFRDPDGNKICVVCHHEVREPEL
jgi:catechol 2,3-dioxygenase-like lactoylglutathione lyase family enzyme